MLTSIYVISMEFLWLRRRRSSWRNSLEARSKEKQLCSQATSVQVSFFHFLWQSLWKQDTLGSFWTTVINFITAHILFFVNHLLIQIIGHLPDSNNLLFKMRPNMKMSLIFMRILSHSEIKVFAVTLVLKQACDNSIIVYYFWSLKTSYITG